MTAPRTFMRALPRLRPSHAPASSTTRQFTHSTSSTIISRQTTLPPKHRATFRICRPSQAAAVARAFSTTPARQHGHIDPPKPGQEIWVTFIDKDGDEHKIAANKGDNLLDVAQAHDLEMEGTESPALSSNPLFSLLASLLSSAFLLFDQSGFGSKLTDCCL